MRYSSKKMFSLGDMEMLQKGIYTLLYTIAFARKPKNLQKRDYEKFLQCLLSCAKVFDDIHAKNFRTTPFANDKIINFLASQEVCC